MLRHHRQHQHNNYGEHNSAYDQITLHGLIVGSIITRVAVIVSEEQSPVISQVARIASPCMGSTDGFPTLAAIGYRDLGTVVTSYHNILRSNDVAMWFRSNANKTYKNK
ncbi:MAG: hypothetical protein RBG13Loki_4025 [Promethearchaeota archaeon CR_4]|nr:MAG: hypothetical protein RBG13Loki_4025 [Candidatus Lokiarchaeota archaeon CR_4]